MTLAIVTVHAKNGFFHCRTGLVLENNLGFAAMAFVSGGADVGPIRTTMWGDGSPGRSRPAP